MKAYEALYNISKIYQNLISGTPLSRGEEIGLNVCTEERCKLWHTTLSYLEAQLLW